MKPDSIILDIDGTLVAALSRPTPQVRQGVRQARALGNLVFLCTGRNLPIIGPDILEIGFDGIVASAGGYVSVGDQVLFDSLLPEEVVQGIDTDPQMEALLRSASPDPCNSELIRMQKEIETGIAIQPYERYPRRGAYKLCFTSISLKPVEEARNFLGNRFEFVVHPYGNSTRCFNGEIIPRGIDKGKGIELVCRHFGASLKDTVAFGDSMNDAAMLARAGLSVAMGNACDELKAMADIICEDVAHDGVYREFCRLGLCG